MMIIMKRSQYFFLILLVSLLITTSVNAQATNPNHLAQALKTTITLDADLSDWEGLPQYTVNLSNTEDPTMFEQAGYYQVAWDDTNLYLLGVFQQSQDSLTTGFAEDDEQWWTGDSFELFVRFTGQEPLHFAANPDGTRFTAFLTSNAYESFSEVQEQQWVIQLAFPFNNDLPRPNTTDSWEIKVGRTFHAAQEFSLWPMGGDFLGEDNYGLLYFTEALEDNAALFERLNP